MRWTPEQLAEYEARGLRKEKSISASNDSESKLHDQIIDYCNSQWPRWKFIRARMDKRSTIQTGAQDFTIFMPCGRVLCVECKNKTGKVSQEQWSWAAEMVKLGHPVHLVRSFQEFISLVENTNHPPEKMHD